MVTTAQVYVLPLGQFSHIPIFKSLSPISHRSLSTYQQNQFCYSKPIKVILTNEVKITFIHSYIKHFVNRPEISIFNNDARKHKCQTDIKKHTRKCNATKSIRNLNEKTKQKWVDPNTKRGFLYMQNYKAL